MIRIALYLSMMALFTQCAEQEPKTPASSNDTTAAKPGRAPINRPKPAADITYRLVPAKAWLKANKADSTSSYQHLISTINRIDRSNMASLDSILVPSDSTADIAWYLPFPHHVKGLEEIRKIIFFSYPSQTFGAYEYGELVYTGATNMGRKKDPTPEGLYYTNWKAEETTSTFNDEWELKWNFNIENKLGVGWHQYALPGYPASHSCLRLLEKDARYLYDWADQWKIKGTDEILAKGNPVVVFGSYPFGGKKPWLELVSNPRALDISEATLEGLIAAKKSEILAEQSKTGQ